MDKTGANEEGSRAYESKQYLLQSTSLRVGELVVPLLEDCTLCGGSGKGEADHYGPRICSACTEGLMPNDNGDAVIKFLENFMEISGGFSSLKGR